MKTTRETVLNGLAILIAMMFFYAAYSKLIAYDKTKHEMLNQVFPGMIALQLAWLVPVVELVIVGFFLYTPLRKMGFYASAILLTTFSLYISITMTGIFGRVPCSCGGILTNMSYGMHLLFNLFFIVLAILGIALESQWKPNNRWFNFLKRKEVRKT